jgi:hypothetical protein
VFSNEDQVRYAGAEPLSNSSCFRYPPRPSDPTTSPTDPSKLTSMTFDIFFEFNISTLRPNSHSIHHHDAIPPSPPHPLNPPNLRLNPTPKPHNMPTSPLHHSYPLHGPSRNLHTQLRHPLGIPTPPIHLRREIHLISNCRLIRPTTPSQYTHFAIHIARKR